MANAIELVTKYLPILDQQYKYGSKSSVLDTPPAFIRATQEANKFKIAHITTQGLANYSKANGFVAGDETLTWEEYTYPWDRGRSFQVDDMDDLESMMLAFGQLSGNFMRYHVIPEIDACRFALYASKAGTTVADAPTADTILDMLNAANLTMDNDEIPEDGRKCFLRPEIANMLETSSKLSKYIEVTTGTTTVGGRTISTRVASYNQLQLIKVPENRFYNSVTLAAAGEGGYAPAAGAKKLDFLVVHPSCVFQDMKHSVSRVWAPSRAKSAGTDGVNPNGDAWKFDYRLYHGAFAYDQLHNGIYAGASTVVG